MYFRRNGMSEIEVKRMRKEGNDTIGSFIERDIEIQKQTHFNRISRYSRRKV